MDFLTPEEVAIIRPAAVLIGVIPRKHGATALLTVRPTTMSTHAGQVAFPGGKVDPIETPLDFLMNTANHQSNQTFYKGKSRQYYEMPHNGYRIWGVTAGIIRRLYQTLYEG